MTRMQVDGDPLLAIGRVLVFAGIALLLAGIALLVMRHVPFFGNLPGDVHYRGKTFEFHFPLMTCLVISLVITLIIWIIARLR